MPEAAGAADRLGSAEAGARRRDRLLPWSERAYVSLAQRAVASRALDRPIGWLVRNVGARWVHALAERRLHVIGAERLPPFEAGRSYIVASNHRSYFDMFVICAFLMRERGLGQRVTFPVRSEFVYDNLLGFLINGCVTFFTMYPPIWRDRRRMSLTVESLREMARLLASQGWVIGFHPEGARNKDPDVYTLLRPHSGLGRVVSEARVPVIPVFIHGIGNDLVAEIHDVVRRRNPITIVFGAPVEMNDLPEVPREKLYMAISERVMAAIRTLADEEREARNG